MSALWQRGWVHGLAGALVMGSWALFANLGFGWADALQAALVQACLSGTITLFLKRGLEAIIDASSGWKRRVLPPLAAATLSFTLLGSVHYLAGTPQVLATLAVPMAVVTVYAALYANALIAIRGSQRSEQ